MRTPDDAVRSMALYAARSLGADWEVRFEDEEGAFERPFCRVQVATPVRNTMRSIAAIECRQTFSVVCYPKEKDTAVDARMEADRVVELLFQAFMVGTHEAAFGREENSGLPDRHFRRGHPLRIPLYDFDGVAVTELPPEDSRAANDFLLIDEPPEFGVLEGTSRDDERETLYTVTGDVRCMWTRSTGRTYPGQVAEAVVVGGQPGP